MKTSFLQLALLAVLCAVAQAYIDPSAFQLECPNAVTGSETTTGGTTGGTSAPTTGGTTGGTSAPTTGGTTGGTSAPTSGGTTGGGSTTSGASAGGTSSTTSSSSSTLSGAGTGDPHFSGFLGQKYDFHGEPWNVYNIISDKHFQMNARFAPNAKWTDGQTFMDAVGIMVGDTRNQFLAICQNGTMNVLVDNQHLTQHEPVFVGSRDGSYMLISYDSSRNVQISTPSYEVSLWRYHGSASDCFIDMQVSYIPSPDSDPHGVLGQTATEGQVFNGVDDDYRIMSNDIFGTDFKFNRFENVALSIQGTRRLMSSVRHGRRLLTVVPFETIVANGCYGCTDSAATNYEPSAYFDDGSCIYTTFILDEIDLGTLDTIVPQASIIDEIKWTPSKVQIFGHGFSIWAYDKGPINLPGPYNSLHVEQTYFTPDAQLNPDWSDATHDAAVGFMVMWSETNVQTYETTTRMFTYTPSRRRQLLNMVTGTINTNRYLAKDNGDAYYHLSADIHLGHDHPYRINWLRITYDALTFPQDVSNLNIYSSLFQASIKYNEGQTFGEVHVPEWDVITYDPSVTDDVFSNPAPEMVLESGFPVNCDYSTEPATLCWAFSSFASCNAGYCRCDAAMMWEEFTGKCEYKPEYVIQFAETVPCDLGSATCDPYNAACMFSEDHQQNRCMCPGGGMWNHTINSCEGGDAPGPGPSGPSGSSFPNNWITTDGGTTSVACDVNNGHADCVGYANGNGHCFLDPVGNAYVCMCPSPEYVYDEGTDVCNL